jgi:hypothetical protein
MTKEHKMKIRVFALPNCSICKNLWEMFISANKAGKLDVTDIEYKTISKDISDKELTSLADFGIDPPAYVLLEEDDTLAFAQGDIVSLRSVSIANIRKLCDARKPTT